MTVITKRKPGPERTGHGGSPPMIHLYIDVPVEIGSRALCGWVKRTPPDPSLWNTAEPTCMVCAHLAGRVQ